MILGCHDLNIFSPRGAATTQKDWRKRIRQDFIDLAISEIPEIVFHHPHDTDSERIWKASWNELVSQLPQVKSYAGSGKYHNSAGIQRSVLPSVLSNNTLGNILDFVFTID